MSKTSGKTIEQQEAEAAAASAQAAKEKAAKEAAEAEAAKEAAAKEAAEAEAAKEAAAQAEAEAAAAKAEAEAAARVVPPASFYANTGYFSFAEPDPDTIEINDIALALSRTARWRGFTHGPMIYTVAQHSILVAAEARKKGLSEDMVRVALMHDATEAYMGDCITPLKRLIPEFAEIEERVYLAIAERFDLLPEIPDEVHAIDAQITANERRDLKPRAPAWEGLPEPNGPFITPLPSTQAADGSFRHMATKLGIV